MKLYTKHQTVSPFPSFFRLILLPFRLLFKALKVILTFPAKILPHRLMRKLNSTQRLFLNMVVVATLLIFGVWIYTSFVNPEQTKAAWFDNNWNYRQTVPVTNDGSAMSRSQLPITLDTASLISSGKMRSDCRDIRVTSSTGEILKQWVHRCNTSATVIYVWALNIPSGNSNFYLYYGNLSAGTNTDIPTGTSQSPGISCKLFLITVTAGATVPTQLIPTPAPQVMHSQYIVI